MQWLRDEGKIVLRDWWSLDTSRKTIKRSLEIWCCWGSRGKDLLFLLYPHWKFSLLRVHHEEVKQADLKFYPIIISNPRKFTTGFLAFLRPVSQHHQIEIILSCPDAIEESWILIKHGHWFKNVGGNLQVCIYDLNLRNSKVIVAR